MPDSSLPRPLFILRGDVTSTLWPADLYCSPLDKYASGLLGVSRELIGLGFIFKLSAPSWKSFFLIFFHGFLSHSLPAPTPELFIRPASYGFIETLRCPFVYVLHTTSFKLGWQCLVCATKIYFQEAIYQLPLPLHKSMLTTEGKTITGERPRKPGGALERHDHLCA